MCRKWQPTPVVLPGESHGQRSLVGYSPWGHKELDTTEHAHMHTMCQALPRVFYVDDLIFSSCNRVIILILQIEHWGLKCLRSLPKRTSWVCNGARLDGAPSLCSWCLDSATCHLPPGGLSHTVGAEKQSLTNCQLIASRWTFFCLIQHIFTFAVCSVGL